MLPTSVRSALFLHPPPLGAQSRSSPWHWATAAMCCALAAFAISCGNHNQPGPKNEGQHPTEIEAPKSTEGAEITKKWPQTAVLAVGDVPILAPEVERIADWIELFDPGKVKAAYLRKALTVVLLQRAAVADRFSTEREKAIESANKQLMELRLAPNKAEGVRAAEGGWNHLGLVLWGETRGLPNGQWSGPFEDVGRLLLLRLKEAFPGKLPGADEFRVEVIEFDFVPEGFDVTALQAVVESSVLAIIEPTFGDLIPTQWRYWMNLPR